MLLPELIFLKTEIESKVAEPITSGLPSPSKSLVISRFEIAEPRLSSTPVPYGNEFAVAGVLLVKVTLNDKVECAVNPFVVTDIG
jgi:hypothetical protein